MMHGSDSELRLACRLGGAWDRSLDEVLTTIAAAGFRAVALSMEAVRHAAAERDAERLTQRIRAHGLIVASFQTDDLAAATTDQARDLAGRLEAQLAFARQLGLDAVAIAADRRCRQSMTVLLDGLRILAEQAAASKLRLRMLNRRDTRLEQIEDVRYAAGELQGHVCELAVDVGEFHASGVNACHVFREFPTRVGEVWLGDRRGRRPVPIGSGEVNLGAMIRGSRAIGFAGWFCVSLQTHGTEAVSSLRACREHLISLARLGG